MAESPEEQDERQYRDGTDRLLDENARMYREIEGLRSLLRQAMDCTRAAGDARHAEYSDWRAAVERFLR